MEYRHKSHSSHSSISPRTFDSAHAYKVTAVVSMAIKMAANFAESWRACGTAAAEGDGGYCKSDTYSNVLDILTNSSNQ